jgi:CheY-like chemotaxis protein
MAGEVLSVLIVDDDVDIRLLMRVTLTAAPGIRVVAEAADGDTAIDAWRQHRPDVVVTDLRMPRMSGLEAAAVILGEWPSQTIVLCSAYADTAAQQQALALGVTTCVDKTQISALDGIVRQAHLQTSRPTA